MTAAILPFRLARRRNLTRSVARRMTDLHPDSAERHLQRQLLIQREALERKGVDPDIVAREIAGLEAAIRGELWHLVLAPESIA